MTGTNRIRITFGALLAGVSLSGAYLLCIVLDRPFPSVGMRLGWSVLLPGFSRITPIPFATGLVETFLLGATFAAIIAPIYNLYFSARDRIEEFQARRYNDRLKHF
jgi:hypothetical protein